jgi:site-specific DNA recombinase
MKQVFAYIRVSKPKKGGGVSLEQQQAAIERYVAQQDLSVTAWFKEKKTAATQGRPVFNEMMRQLRERKASGVVMHKVDRSARNLRDWTDLEDLIEAGVELHFAHDAIDMKSRGGRLSADLQAVIAADYIRNLREEALKGIEGRLKQGILPHHAPIGYLDCGPGQPKAVDPVRGPIVGWLFERYGAGDCTLRDLTDLAASRGLRNSAGKPLRLTQIHYMLRNVFYAGVLKSARFGIFTGAHQPIVRRALFDRVQEILSGKFVRHTKRHFFRFRRLLHCKTCGRSLIGSRVKGIIYYRCSTVSCPTTSVREDAVDAEVRNMLQWITLGDTEADRIAAELAAMDSDTHTLLEKRRAALTEVLATANARFERLTGLLLDDKIDPTAYDQARSAIVLGRQKLEQDLATADEDQGTAIATAGKIVELARTPLILYESADDERKRLLVETVMSNCVVMGKSLEFSLREPFATLAKRRSKQHCRVQWNTPRTFPVETLIQWVSTVPRALLDDLQLTKPQNDIAEA